MNKTENNAQQGLKKNWTDQEDSILRELVVDQDLPYAKAAKILGRGRAACISRGRRLGIKKGRRILRPGATKTIHHHPWRNKQLPQEFATKFPQFRPDSPPPSPCGISQIMPPESRLTHRPKQSDAPAPKRLIDLEPSECRWPVGEVSRDDINGTETVFCGCKSLKGKSYCKEHHETAYVQKEGHDR